MKINNTMVSVLMTAFNREKYISAAIESVLASSYQDFELIVVDDCSNDKTVEIAKSFEEKDTRIKVFINETNLGDYPNRNKAASYATGKYLKYVDADDYIYPWGLEILVKCMEENPTAGWGLCSLSQIVAKPYPFILQPKEAYLHNFFKATIFEKAPLSSIICRDAFNNIGGFSGKQHLGDFEFWHIIALKYPVVLMPDGIVWYREHDDQQNNDNLTNPLIPFKYTVSQYHFIKNNSTLIPMEKEKTKQVEARLRKAINICIIKNIIKGHFTSVIKMLKMKNDYVNYNFTIN